MFEDIRKLADHNEEYLMKLLPNAQKVDNELVCAGIMGYKGKGFSYNLLSGLWSDFASGRSGCGVIDLICAREDCTADHAAFLVNLELGNKDAVATNDLKPASKETLNKYTIAPIQSKPTYYFTEEGDKIELADVWLYKNEVGQTVASDARYDDLDNNKHILHFLYNNETRTWYDGLVKKDRVLFNLDKIKENDKKTVIVCEGCKTAEAAQKYFTGYTATTWQGEPKTWDKTNWSPIFGRNVIIVPDADAEGRKTAEQIANHLKNNRTNVRIVATESMEAIKKGWDLADAWDGGMSQEQVIEFVRQNIRDFVKIDDENKKEVIDTEVIIKEKEPVTYDDTYFRCLGVQSDNTFFYKKQTCQIIEFNPSSYEPKHLINLAPLSWWQMRYPQRKEGADWQAATDDICRIQEKIGFYDSAKIRGRGAWFDNGRTVLHLGNVLFVNGQLVAIEDFKSEYFYEQAPALAVKIQTNLPKEDASKLIKLCRMARWDNPVHGDILAGWLFSALVCGALPFRSHLYLIGAQGTGKSWMLDNVVKRVMGNIALSVSSKSTEAGIRDSLGGDIRPVIFDEAEAENTSDKIRMQAVFDLARNGSSEKADAIVKFGAKYICRSAFLFASINSSMSKSADLARTAFIKLANAPVKKSIDVKIQDNKNFRELEAFASRLLTDEYCRCLLSRAIYLVPILRKSHQIIADLAAKEYGSRRLGDQMAMIIAGIWGLQSDEPITEAEARRLIDYTCMTEEKDDLNNQTQEENCLDHLLFSNVEIMTKTGARRYNLGALVAFLAGTEELDLDLATATKDLASKGIKIDVIGSREFLILSTLKSAHPQKLYGDTEWEFGWKDALLRIEGVERVKLKRFFSTLVSSAIAVPLNLVIKSAF